MVHFNRVLEKKYLGDEPVLKQQIQVQNDSRLISAVNWYNHFYEKQDIQKYILEYATLRKYSAADITAITKTKYVFPLFYCAIARMICRGAILPDVLISNLENSIRKAIAEVMAVKPPSVKILAKTKARDPKTIDCIADIENALDSFFIAGYKLKTPIDFLSILKKHDVSTSGATEIVDYYKPLLLELSKIDEDPQIKEHYQKLKRQQLVEYSKILLDIIGSVKTYIGHIPVVVRTRKTIKKKKTPEQLSAKVKYCLESKPNNIVSIHPKTIVGCSAVLLYNIKYKKLILLFAEPNNTLSVKGTSVINYSDSSLSKKLRKPSEVLPTATTWSLPKATTSIKSLKTKASVATGRINTDVVIMKVFK